MIRLALGLVLIASGAAADGTGTASLRDRLRALAAPEIPSPAPSETYAEEIASDLSRIGAHGTALFGPGPEAIGTGPVPAAIAIFTGPDCDGCAEAEAALGVVVEELGLRANIIDTADPAQAALMAALTLDTLPSYVMPDRLIRGEMPAFVLHRYLSETR